MTIKTLWFVYDFGLGGDYEGLYTFLDSLDAKECGNNVAFFESEFDDLEVLKRNLSDIVNIQKNDRIYLIYKDAENKLKGKFLFGNRRKNPWAGYGVKEVEREEEVE